MDESRAAVKSSHSKSRWRVIGWETKFNDWKDRIHGMISTNDFFKEHKMYETQIVIYFPSTLPKSGYITYWNFGCSKVLNSQVDIMICLKKFPGYITLVAK